MKKSKAGSSREVETIRLRGSSPLTRIKDKLFLWRYVYYYDWLFKWWDFKKRIKAKIFCKRGYHKIYRSYISCGGKSPSKKSWKRRSDYIACRNCNYLYFSTLKDARNHKWIINAKNKTDKNIMKKILRYIDEKSNEVMTNGEKEEEFV